MRLADYKKKSEEWEVLINFDNLTKSMGKKLFLKRQHFVGKSLIAIL